MNDIERRQMKTIVGKELVRAKRLATRELVRVEPRLIETFGAIERYAADHPRQAAAIAVSLGAAMGAAGALLFGRKEK